MKRGNIFKRYQKKYNFIFQDNILRCDKVGKDLSYQIDVRDAVVTRDKKSKKVFKIKSPQTKLTLKAADEMERELWVQNLTRIAKVYAGEDVSKRGSAVENSSDLRLGSGAFSIESGNHLGGYNTVGGGGIGTNKKIVKQVKTVKTVTLNQISDILQKQDAKLQSTLGESSRCYLTFVRDLKSLELELHDDSSKTKQQKDKLVRIQEAAKAYQD